MNKHGYIYTIITFTCIVVAGISIYFQQQLAAVRQENSNLKGKISKFQAETVAPDQKESPSADTASQYVDIPVIHARYPITPQNESLLYAYRAISSDSSAGSILFTNTKLAHAQDSHKEDYEFPCGLFGRDNPRIMYYQTDTVTVVGQASKIGKKVGDHYYVYSYPQAVCSDLFVSEQNELSATVKAVFDSLEPLDQ